MAGASVASFLADTADVIILEAEERPGFHSTGRSAALYAQAYGNAAIRALTIGGKPFFMDPPDGFADHPLLTPRGELFIAREDQRDALHGHVEEIRERVSTIEEIDAAEAVKMVPALRREYVAAAAYEPGAMDMDVDAIHQGFLRRVRRAGGTVVTNAGVISMARTDGVWRVTTPAGVFEAPIVVNASGAWADRIAEMAGCRPVGLQPKRRTAIIFAGPEGVDCSRWPMVIDADEEFYFKPEAGMLLGSPADETPVDPHDVQPEELDIAIAVDRIQTATEIPIRRIEHRWAGLRTFVPDKTPVAGYDDHVDGFFWLAGQGGYGIQTAPGLGRTAAALISGDEIPADLQAVGVEAAALSPRRLRRAP